MSAIALLGLVGSIFWGVWVADDGKFPLLPVILGLLCISIVMETTDIYTWNPYPYIE